jgi:hypothetical protein
MGHRFDDYKLMTIIHSKFKKYQTSGYSQEAEEDGVCVNRIVLPVFLMNILKNIYLRHLFISENIMYTFKFNCIVLF